MKVSRREGDGQVRLVVQEDIVVDNVEEFRSLVQGALDSSPFQLVIDMANMSYLCSAGIGVIAMAHRRLKERGQGLIVANCSPKVHRLFTVTRLDSVLEFVYDAVEDAD